jgi:hypothetical protein
MAEVNIWADPAGAATVRSITGGSETVPTVIVAGTGLVNPKVRTVLDAVRAVAPDLLRNVSPAKSGKRVDVLAVLQWSVVATLVVASFVVEAAGYSGASWAIDGINLVVFVGFRSIRRHLDPTGASNTSTTETPS